MVQTNALAIGADTGPWLRLVPYERIARAAGNAHYYKRLRNDLTGGH